MMPTMRTLLFTFFVYASFTNAASLSVRSWQEDSVGFEGVDNTVDRDQDRTTFSRLLSAVSPRALQQLVHEYVPNPFKDGVFSSDRNGGDVYVRGPVLATSIVRLAVRQATSGNDTSTSDTPTSSSDVPATSTSDVPSTTPTEEPTTSTEEPTTSTDAPPTETTETPPDTPTTSSSTTPTPAPTPTTEPSSTTEAPTENPDPTSSSSPSSTPAPESSSDIDPSSSTPDTVSTSTTATPTSKTSTFTSTLPNGAVTTVTEVAVVTPGATEGDDDGTPTSGMGNLQTDSPAPIVRGPGFGIIAGLLVGGVMLA